MNTDHDDKELLDLLDGAAREEGGDAPAADRAEYATLLKDLRAGDDAAPSKAFNRSLREAWAAEVGARSPKAQQRHHWWRLSMSLAAAAVIGFVLLWPGGVVNNGNAGGVAWADVVKAMDRVSHFHLIAFSDDPRRADEKMKMFRIDLFYQQPDRWRAHGMGHVAFAAGDVRQTWSVEKRKFTEKGERAPDLFPGDFVAQHRKSGTLSAILSSIFRGKVPQGEPVKSDGVSAAQGIDVFDYATNATEKWVRIWVLRESKLPLKMHLFYPGSDEFMLVTFDYSDPQPDGFFDAAAFAAEAKKLQTGDPYRYYGIGSTPVAGTRPRGADQVHAVEGGYRAPVVKRVLSNAEGDVAIVTDNPRNLTPKGSHPLEQEYRHATDNWGNKLISAGGGSRVSTGERHWYLMPLPPVKRGDVPRQVTVSYVIEPQYGEQKVLKTETLAVPDPSVGGEPKDWSKDLPQQKRWALRNHLQRSGTLAQQLEQIERELAADPREVGALAWKFSLLREHGREDVAWALFERDLRDRIFADVNLLNERAVEAAQYLLYLAASGRDEELRKLSAIARQHIDAAVKAKGSRGSALYNLERTEHNPLLPASHVLEWRETFKDGPQVVRTVAGRDGLVFIELAIPKPPVGWESNGWDGGAPHGWFWQIAFATPWEINARLVKLDANRLWLVARGGVKQVTLSADVRLANDNYGSKMKRHDAVLRWQRTIDVPEGTVDDVRAWWTKEAGNTGWWPRPPLSTQPATAPDGAAEWMTEAAKLRDAGRFEEALPLYEKALAAPREQWPPAYTQGVGLLADTVEMAKRQMRVSQAQCLAELGRLDEARRIASDLRAALPEKPDLSDSLQGHLAADALAAALAIPRVLLKRGDAQSAAAELDRIAARRPDMEELPRGTIMVDRGRVKIGWSPRSHQEDAWRHFDAVWWDAREALQSKAPASRPTTSAAAG